MKLCDNSIILSIFILIKIFICIIYPIIIIKKRKYDYVRYFIITEIILIMALLISNIFSLNSCVYNSNISGIKKANLKSKILEYNSLHYSDEDYTNITDIDVAAYYKTYIGKDFYYYNQNDVFLKEQLLECGNNKYFNKFGAPITSTAMAVSTILDTKVTPIDILDLYNSEFFDCSSSVNIGDVFAAVVDRYAGLNISEIPGSMVRDSIMSGGVVIAEIGSNGNSEITCGKTFITLYNITLNGNVIIADPDDSENSFACSYSSLSYGKVLKPNRTNTEWSLDEINSQTLHYYLVKGA